MSNHSKFIFLLAVATLLLPIDAQAQSKKSALANRIQQLKKNQESSDKSDRTGVENKAYKTMLSSVVLINCVGTDGNGSSGTGWVVDKEQKLIVTNHHVVSSFIECDVYFPQFKDGKLVTDRNESIVSSRAHRVNVIDVDAAYDLALLQLKGDLPEEIKALEIAEKPALPGETIHSVAGSTVGAQSLWVYSTGHVRQTVRGMMANDYEAMLLESDMATNQGNSGGPVCNDNGEVVAVVEGHRTDARLVSIYVSQEALIEYLSDALRCVAPKTKDNLVFSAERNLDDGRPNVAMKLVDQAIKLDPNSAPLLSLRGWCWYHIDDTDSSAADFQEAIELDKTFADAHSGLGYLALDAERNKEAVRHFTNAIRNDSDQADYIVARGLARREMDRDTAALRDFERAIEKNPNHLNAIKYRGYTKIDLGQSEEGLKDLEAVVQHFAQDAEIFFYYGEALYRDSEFAEALKFYGKSVELDPEEPDFNYGFAMSLMNQGQFKAALPYFSKSYQTDPDNPRFVYFMGLNQMASGDPAGDEFVERGVKMAPDDEMIQDNYQYLLQKRSEAQAAN